MVLVWAGWILAAVAVGANWLSRTSENPRLETVSKPAATVSIAALALSVSDGAPTAAIVSALIGFAFCLVGDIALLPSVDRFVVGLGAFLVAHVAFIVMFAELGFVRRQLAVAALAWMVVVAATVGRRIVSGARTEAPALTGPVAAYLLVIATMAVAGWSTGRGAAIVGSGMFVVSDSLLGWRKFVREEAWMSLAVMMTYHAALLGLALSLA